jgi:hypothetical protein
MYLTTILAYHPAFYPRGAVGPRKGKEKNVVALWLNQKSKNMT